jgi:ribosomal protein S18 acetylase RimI-like enzyme
MITDIGIDREYVKNGIGSELLAIARQEAGGKKDIIVFINANENAIPFYEKNGLTRSNSVMELTDIEWTSFEVQKGITL